MKIALITDSHFGVRNDSQIFSDYFSKFYNEIFFPYLDEHNIDTVLHLGDLVDRRKYINFLTANHLYDTFIKPLEERDIEFHCILGNHDIFFRNNLTINALQEMYRNSDIVNIIDTPTELIFDDIKMLMVPWICNDNKQSCFDAIENTNANILMGHLELSGFEMHRGSICESGLDKDRFNKFELVLSGHFHHKSHYQNIHYLGSPYEMTWSDYDDPKGFHVFDTETRKIEFVRNPHSIFHKIYYDDSGMKLEDIDDMNFSIFEKTYIKLVVENKTNPYMFDLFVDKIEKSGVANLQIVEDFFSLDNSSESNIIDEAKSTLEILDEYISSIETKVSEKKLNSIFQNLYQEAINLE
jgi:3',5'-cyclic AMP phosphodiesterase CpdA